MLLAILMVGSLACSKFNKLQKRGTPEEKLAAALVYFEKKDYYRAGLLFEDVIPLLRGTEQNEKAQFYYAYCQYYSRQLLLASYYFKQFYETFPNSSYAEEATYMHAISLYEDSPPYYLDQENTYKSLDAIENYLLQFPNSKNKDYLESISDNLAYKLERKDFENAKLFFRKMDYKAADIALRNFARDYSESEFLEETLYMLVVNAYEYANNSVVTRQPERYDMAIEYYADLEEQFPGSRYTRLAKSYYKSAMRKQGREIEQEEEPENN